MNEYTLPADDRELLVQAVERAGKVRAKRAQKLAQIQDRLHSATGDAARECYGEALHAASAALATADRIKRDAKARLERYFAAATAQQRMAWAGDDVTFQPA
jgi:hypothetical protein